MIQDIGSSSDLFSALIIAFRFKFWLPLILLEAPRPFRFSFTTDNGLDKWTMAIGQLQNTIFLKATVANMQGGGTEGTLLLVHSDSRTRNFGHNPDSDTKYTENYNWETKKMFGILSVIFLSVYF